MAVQEKQSIKILGVSQNTNSAKSRSRTYALTLNNILAVPFPNTDVFQVSISTYEFQEDADI